MRLVLGLVVAGVMVGSVYGVLAVTQTLMFRTAGVLSFAHGGFALIGAYTYAGLSCRSGGSRLCAGEPLLRPWQNAAVAVALATLAALAIERLVMRPLQSASATHKLVASAGALALCSGIMLQINGPEARMIPERGRLIPPGSVRLLGVVIDSQRAAIFLVSLVLLGCLAAVLRWSWFGLALRTVGQSPESARLIGVSPVMVSRFNWALAGALSGLTGVLLAPISVVNVGTFSFLMVKTVAAALLAGLVSLPLAFLGGLAIGLVEGVVPHFWETQGSASVGIAVLVVVVVSLHRDRLSVVTAGMSDTHRGVTRSGPAALWLATVINLGVNLATRVPKALRIGIVLAAALSLLRNDYYSAVGLNVLYYSLVTLSLYLILGLGGQPSLMQAGFVGIGAFSLATGLRHGLPVPVAMAIGVGLCAVAGVVVGVFSLRFRRLAFAIVSLTLGTVISDFLLTRSSLTSVIQDPQLFGFNLLDTRNAYALMLVLTVLAFRAATNLRRSSWGRALGATHDLQSRVGHFGFLHVRAEVCTFAFSAALAGLGGCALALLTSSFNAFQFIPLVSLTLLLAAVVGGYTSIWGSVIAGVIFGYGPQLLSGLSQNAANAYPQIVGSLLALFLLVTTRGGLAALPTWTRDVLTSRQITPPDTVRGHRVAALSDPPGRERPALATRGKDGMVRSS